MMNKTIKWTGVSSTPIEEPRFVARSYHVRKLQHDEALDMAD